MLKPTARANEKKLSEESSQAVEGQSTPVFVEKPNILDDVNNNRENSDKVG